MSYNKDGAKSSPTERPPSNNSGGNTNPQPSHKLPPRIKKISNTKFLKIPEITNPQMKKKPSKMTKMTIRKIFSRNKPLKEKSKRRKKIN
jgi:hypothetical protein